MRESSAGPNAWDEEIVRHPSVTRFSSTAQASTEGVICTDAVEAEAELAAYAEPLGLDLTSA
ncbi:hypothetical protein GCM10010504_33710 [Streptomyces griseus]|nr:hypothetical protein GCM10010504_33710 [Streptomyces griseus]